MYLVVHNEKSLSCLLFFNPLILKLKINLVFLFAHFVMTMLISIFLITFKLLWFHTIFFPKPRMYTPQQNGIVEHKNRDFIETTRTLLLHGQVSQQFWGDLFSSHSISLIAYHSLF